MVTKDTVTKTDMVTKDTVTKTDTVTTMDMATMTMKQYATTQRHTKTQNTPIENRVRQLVTFGWLANQTMELAGT